MTEMPPQKPAPRWRGMFDVATTVVMLLLAVVIVWQGRARLSGSPGTGPAAIPLPAEPIEIGNSATLGSSAAPVAIVEYADFECSFCAKFAQEIKPALQKEYIDTGRVLFVFKHFPLVNHANAPAAARAAWCAGEQSRFQEMHNALFSLSGRLAGADYERMARESGLELEGFKSCISSDGAKRAVEAERAEGDKLNVTGTPRFFLGKLGSDGKVRVSAALSGAKPLATFKEALDRLF